MNLPSYELREKLFQDKGFKSTVEGYKKKGYIKEFDESLWEKINNTNVPCLKNFMLIFEEGMNISTCGETVKYLSFLFEDFQIANGTCGILKGTEGSPNGEHVWLESAEDIYDTTLLLIINKELGYELFNYVRESTKGLKELSNDIKYVWQRQMSSDKEAVRRKKGLVEQLEKVSREMDFF